MQRTALAAVGIDIRLKIDGNIYLEVVERYPGKQPAQSFHWIFRITAFVVNSLLYNWR